MERHGNGNDATQSYVHEDVLVEILLRLPSKSIIRFKMVSKSWFCLISSTSFIRRHLDFIKSRPSSSHGQLVFYEDYQYYGNQNQSLKALLLHDQKITNLNLPTSHPDLVSRVHISNPVNGIYCVDLQLKNLPYDSLVLALWNPAINQVHSLPLISYPPREIPIQVPNNLSMDEVERFHKSYGFGFDSSVNDYKVVVITVYASWLSYHPPLISCFKIYSLATNTWKEFDPLKVSIVCPSCTDVGHNGRQEDVGPLGGFYFNEACHWHYTCINNTFTCRCIVCFHLKDEVFGVHRVPEAILRKSEYEVASVKGCLAVVCSAENSDVDIAMPLPMFDVFDVWVMREYGVESSWCHAYRITTKGTRSIFIGIVDEEIFRQEIDNGQLLISYGLYDPYKKRRQYCFLPKVRQILPYCESIVPVNPNCLRII